MVGELLTPGSRTSYGTVKVTGSVAPVGPPGMEIWMVAEYTPGANPAGLADTVSKSPVWPVGRFVLSHAPPLFTCAANGIGSATLVATRMD